jgi:hypothetical protein
MPRWDAVIVGSSPWSFEWSQRLTALLFAFDTVRYPNFRSDIDILSETRCEVNAAFVSETQLEKAKGGRPAADTAGRRPVRSCGEFCRPGLR